MVKFQEVIDNFPNSTFEKMAYRSIADIWRRQKLWDKAIENYRMAANGADEHMRSQMLLQIKECLEAKGEKKTGGY